MQRYTMVFITTKFLHVSGGSSAHLQELKTLYTASGICGAFSSSYRYREWVGTGLRLHTQTSSNSFTTAVRSRKTPTNTRCCIYSF